MSFARANVLQKAVREFPQEERVKKGFLFFAVLSGVLWTCLPADSTRVVEQVYEAATVVSVERHQPVSNYLGENPADAPLRAREYSYDIGIRLACNVYVGRYLSAINYLPSVFAPNQTVDVRLQKHFLYVSLPDSDWDVKMGIVSHRRVTNEFCAAGL
jgi:hypothetical protein